MEIDAAQTLPNPVWLRRPTGAGVVRHYPEAALADGVDGEARLNCIADPDLSLRCLVSHEEPAGAGFGAAALGMAQEFRIRENEVGEAAAGQRIRLPIRFNSFP